MADGEWKPQTIRQGDGAIVGINVGSLPSVGLTQM
jgi:hypothetical protein